MVAASTSNINEGGASASPSGVNGARPRFLFNPANYRLNPAARAARLTRDATRDYCEAGLPIFAASPAKIPLTKDWESRSTDDAETIEMMWSQHPNALIGLPPGKVGLVVIDLDRHNVEQDGIAEGKMIVGDFHALGCPIVMTAGGGLHLYFKQPHGKRIGNGRGALPKGIDVRGVGGFAIAPGSVRADGSEWQMAPGSPDLITAFVEGTIPELPEAFLRFIEAKPEREGPEPLRQPAGDAPRATRNASIGERERAYACKALDGEVRDLAATPTGQRNPRLNEAALKIGHYVAAGWIGESEVRQALEEACFANGLIQDDGIVGVRKTIDSGLRKGMQEPAPPLADRERPDAREGRETPRFTKRGHPDDPRPGDAAGDADQSATGDQQPDPLRGFSFDGDAVPEPPKMLVKGLIGDKEIAFVGGQSGAGKTFIVLDLAVSLASGEPFFGRMVKERVGVAIFAGEGSNTIPNRLIVAKNAKAGDDPLPIAWLGEIPDMKRPAEVAAMIPRLHAVDAHFREKFGVRLGVVVADTLAATFDLDDEDDNSEAAKIIRIMRNISDALAVTVVPIHHFGKSTDTGLRGASGWRAGCDTVLAVLANRDQTTGRCDNRRLALSKSRVSEEGLTIPFNLRFVALGTDEDGDEYGSCYVEPGDGFNAAEGVLPKKEAPPPRAARVYLDAFGAVLGEHGRKVRPFGFDGPEIMAVDREIVRGEFYKLWPADGETEKAKAEAKRKSFARGEDWSLTRKKVATYELAGKQLLWLLKEPEQ